MSVKVCLVFFLSAYVLVAQGLPEEKDMHDQIRMLKEIVNKALRENRHVSDSHSSSTTTEASSDTQDEISNDVPPGNGNIYLDPQDFIMKTHCEEVIARDYPSLTYSTFENVRLELVVKALEHLTQDFIHELSLQQNASCIYLTELMGALGYILEDSIAHDLERHMVAYIDHALLHLESVDTIKCMAAIESNSPAELLFGSLYDDFYTLLGDAEELIDLHSPFYMNIIRTQSMVFRNIEMLISSLIGQDIPADKAVMHMLSYIYRWLEAVKYTSPEFVIPEYSPSNCTFLVKQLTSKVEEAITRLLTILTSGAILSNHINDALGSDCASISYIVKEDLHKNIKQWFKPLDILRRVHMELTSHEQTHDLKPALKFTLTTFFELATKRSNKGAYFEGHIYTHVLEKSSPVPLSTPITSVYFEHLEEIMLMFVQQIESHFADFCLDHKLLATLIGLSGMKGLDFTTANLHIVNIAYRIWKELDTAYQTLNSEVRGDLYMKFQEIITYNYRMKLYTHMAAMEKIVTGVPTETLFMDVSIIPGESGPDATLGELLHKVVSAVVPLFYEGHNCSHDHEVYSKTVQETHAFLASVESGDMVTNSSIQDLLSVVPLTVSPAVVKNITYIMKTGLNLEIPHLLEDYHIIAAEIDAHPIEARHAMANFIAEKIAYIIYSEIRKVSFTPIPEPLPTVDVNESLKRIISWQHETITSFFTKYISGLQETMLNLGQSDVDICKVSPGMCSPETLRKRQMQQTKIEG